MTLLYLSNFSKLPSLTRSTSSTRRGAPRAPAPTKTEPTKRLSLDLPQSLHTRFKTACSATRRKMGNELQTFIATRTEELEKEAGITHK